MTKDEEIHFLRLLVVHYYNGGSERVIDRRWNLTTDEERAHTACFEEQPDRPERAP